MADEIRCGPLPLTDVVFIQTALADGFTLDELLARREVDPRDWERAQRAFTKLLARRAAEGDAFILEVDALADKAREAWARRLPPLDEELGAYLDFERHWAMSDDPSRFLEERRMRPSDLLRLGRLWNQRFAADPALRQEALVRLADAPGPCPEVQPSPPRMLEPAPPPRAEAKVAPLPFLDGAVNLPPPPLTAPLPKPKTKGIEGTAHLDNLHQIIAALPFAKAVPSLAPEPEKAAPPAQRSPEPAAPPPSVVALPSIASPPPTLASSTLPSPLVLTAPQEPPVPPPVVRNDALQGTRLALDTPPPSVALPFQSKSTPDEALQGALAHARASQGNAPTPAAPSHLRETSAVFAPPSQALPFQSAPPSVREAPPSAQRRGRLTLEQYASLCVELSLEPQRSSEILARYRLTAEDRRSLDAEWQERFAREPTTWFAWDRAYKTYQAWLREQKGRAT